MLKDILRLSLLGCLIIAIAGCEVSDPGSAVSNQPPETYLVLAPEDSAVFNHFVNLKWSGTDPDGDIAGFWVLVDGDTLMFTTAYEDTIAFYAPGDTVLPHEVQVTAVDDDGLEDPTPSSRFFYTSNTRPSVAFGAGSVPQGAVVGKGFAIELEGEDPNPSSLSYSIAVDDSVGGWLAWSRYSTFLFCDKTIRFLPCTTATWQNVPCTATLIDKDILTAGDHTFYGRVKDAGEATGLEIISVNVTVVDTMTPFMDTVVTGAYGSDEFYPDGSVFYRANRETKLTFSGSADAYHGDINAYRYHIGEGSFTDQDVWQETPEIVLRDHPPNPQGLDIQIQCRDVAGVLSNIVPYQIYILEPDLTHGILVVDETRDGTGNPGSPDDQQVDDFYEAIVGARTHTQLDYATHQIGGVSYISPLDLYKYELVLYHTDDKANYNLADTRVVLAEYMDRGGKVIFSGWDLLQPFGVTDDSASYSATGTAGEQFVYKYMRLFYAVRSSSSRPRECVGFAGVGEAYPDTVAIDPEKLPSSWNGAMDKCWTFTNRGETVTTGTFLAADEESTFNGRHCCHVYLGPTYSTSVIGVPLYFCYQDQAQAYMDELLLEMLGP
jgi:hypothetical protein